MTLDKDRHNEIRREISDKLNELKRLYERCYSSHEGKGNIAFYSNGIRLAEPDIVIEKDNCALVVEIELGNSPKRLMGVAYAIYSSNCGKHSENTIDINRKSLLLVLGSKKIPKNPSKKKSKKPLQIQEIKSLIEKKLKFDYFDIVTDDIASDKIFEWLKGKRGG